MKKATWIWYPGDFEINLGNRMQNRRTERGVFFPPFWKMDSHYVLVEFSKKINLEKSEEISVIAEGKCNIKLDGKMFCEKTITVPAGNHELKIKVYNQENPPAIFVSGETIVSDYTWLVTCEDKEWIDESGKASDTTSGTSYVEVGSWNFDDPQNPPSSFRLKTEIQSAVTVKSTGNGTLADFGRETFGFLVFNNLKGKGKLNIYYGESCEEAMDTAFCETLDFIDIDFAEATNYTLPDSRAFRYVYIEHTGIVFNEVSMLYEYLPVDFKGSFRCNDELVNRIWDVSAYTLHLTTREFFIDGIKRDRWIWSGDAYQSYLMNYYLMFDSAAVRRTMLYLRGKEPVTSHINTIMDYTFYWFLGIYDYYSYTGDLNFVMQIYPKMKSLLDFCLSRRNKNGLMEGLAGDWVFIDWADFPMSKSGAVGFEQYLLYCSVSATRQIAQALENKQDAEYFAALESEIQKTLYDYMFDENRQVFVHNYDKGKQSEQITPFTNIFGLWRKAFPERIAEEIKKQVLMNRDALKITTPYWKFYELGAMCEVGEHERVLNEIRSYWGDMLQLGATSFWEKYNSDEQGAEHLSMYGRPYGKSLCHSWGASPLYLLGKYFLGVQPLEAGYKTFIIEPHLGDLEWIEGDVPTPNGKIHIFRNAVEIRVMTDEGRGTLRFTCLKKPVCRTGTIIESSKNVYTIEIQSGKEYVVKMG